METGNSSKNFFQFPISFTGSNYVTNLDQVFIAGIAGTVGSKTENKITFNWDTRTYKFASVIAIGY